MADWKNLPIVFGISTVRFNNVTIDRGLCERFMSDWKVKNEEKEKKSFLIFLTLEDTAEKTYLELKRCRIVDHEAFIEVFEQFKFKNVTFSFCECDLSRFVDVFQNVERFVFSSISSNDYEGLCDIVEKCKNLKNLSTTFHTEAQPHRILKCIGESNLRYVDLIGNESLAPFMGEVGYMLKSCKSLKEFHFGNIVTHATRAQVKHEEWAAFCEGISNSQLKKLTISTDELTLTQLNMLTFVIPKNPRLRTVDMDIYVSETTLPYLKNLVNHLKSFSFAILDHDIKESVLMFADMIGDSTSLRYLFMYSADPHRISNVIGEDIGKRVERSVHIVGGNSPLFDMKEMISRNRHNLNVCQTSCETLLAVKKFRRHQTVLGPYLSHDMTNLLGKHLMQTWTDVESWKNCKRQKISYF